MPTLNHNTADLLKPHFSYLINRMYETTRDGISQEYYQSTIKFVAHIKPDFFSSLVDLFEASGVGISEHDLQYFTPELFNSATFCLEKNLIDELNIKGKVKISKASVTEEKIRISFELTQTTDDYQNRVTIGGLFNKLVVINNSLSSRPLPVVEDGKQAQAKISFSPEVINLQNFARKLSILYSDLPASTGNHWTYSQFDNSQRVSVRDLASAAYFMDATVAAYPPVVTSTAGIQTSGTVVAFLPRTAIAPQPSATIIAHAPRVIVPNQVRTCVAIAPHVERPINTITVPQQLLTLRRPIESTYTTVAPRLVSAEDSIAAHIASARIARK